MTRALVLTTTLGSLIACRAPSPEIDAAATSAVASASSTSKSTALPSFDASSMVPDAAAGHPELALLCSHYACTPEADRIVLPDGTRVVWDDGKTKTTQERIDGPDVEDVFALGYPKAGTSVKPVVDAEIDPGRVRIEALFRATYGADARAVSSAMVPVKIAGHTVSFHRKAASALERVAGRVAKLLAAEPPLAKFFTSLGGTFNPRNIAGTDHRSAHSWAIAIDIDPSQADYWRFSAAAAGPKWRNRIPQSIVDAFEAEGFVWGGRWFHYDTMHFEYRPELARPGSSDAH